jgi:hypothetical protein
MNKISRGEFMKLSALGMAGSLATPQSAWSNSNRNEEQDEALLQRLIKANDSTVDNFLGQSLGETAFFRSLGSEFAIIVASYCQSKSKHYKSKLFLGRMNEVMDKLLQLQLSDGTLDAGGNRHSPPDTSFLLDHLGPAAVQLNQQNSEELNSLKEKLNKFLTKVGEGLATGGIHTPNHRWVISSALARLYSLYKDEKYLERINDWLGEGIYIDSDGKFPERSCNYAVVEDGAFLTIGRILNRPALFDIVKKNLVSTYYLMENNGDLITLDSRRQDQNFSVPILWFYLHYRYLAIFFKDPFLAAVARQIESFDNFGDVVLSKSLIFFEENPLLLNKLPENDHLPDSYTRFFPLTHLARIRRGKVTASVFGGNDKPLIIASGRSTNPTFFTFIKGSAILEYARLSTSFFNTGYFRSDGLENSDNKYVLYEKKEGYYYQPLPADKRNKNGDYKMSESLDGRFWSKMDFESRPVSNVQVLETGIIISEDDGNFIMDIDVSGPDGVEVTLELCFQTGGVLEGVVPANVDGDYFLKEGYGKYRMGDDYILFGPGMAGHSRIRGLDGELYSTHFGSIKGKGLHVYLTGLTPFKQTFSIK